VNQELNSPVSQKFNTKLGCHSGQVSRGADGSIPLHPLLPLGRGNYRKEGTGLFNELKDYSPFLPLPYWTKVQ
jgi:hypothetical protein